MVITTPISETVCTTAKSGESEEEQGAEKAYTVLVIHTHMHVCVYSCTFTHTHNHYFVRTQEFTNIMHNWRIPISYILSSWANYMTLKTG